MNILWQGMAHSIPTIMHIIATIMHELNHAMHVTMHVAIQVARHMLVATRVATIGLANLIPYFEFV